MQDKNSNPLKLFSIAKSDKDLSKTALPAMTMSSPNKEMLLKLLLNLITTPSNNSSLINIFDPAPKINILSLLSNFFKKLTNSLKLLAL